MKRSKFIQGLTLFSFIFLLTAFVLYRMGKFDEYFSGSNSQYQTSPNGGNIGQLPTDTVPKKAQDSLTRVMLSSSKSMVLIDQKFLTLDSIKFKRKPDAPKPKTRTIMMSSSKSGPVIVTLPASPFDSIKPLYKLDSLKKQWR